MPSRTPHRNRWSKHWARARLVLSQSVVSFFQEDSLTISASIAYHFILSLFPMMLLLVGASGLVIGHYELSGQLATLLERYLPMKPDFILKNLTVISRSSGRATLLSFLLLLWTSSGVFIPLEKALNRAWDVEKGRSWVRSHLVALEMAVLVGFIMLTSTALVTLNSLIQGWLRVKTRHAMSPSTDFAFHSVAILAAFGLTFIMVLLIFQRLPNHPLGIRKVLPGALLTALFWEAARSLFSLLFPLFNYRHVYGSIGVVVALMTWAYASSAVLLFGAQVSNALYRTLEEDESPVRVAPEVNLSSPAGI